MKSESEVAQSCLTLSNLMDCSLLGSSGHGIFQARVLAWVTIAFSSQKGCYQKFTNSKCWGGCGEKGPLLHCWWECKLVQPLWRTVWRFLKKLEIELLYDPAIPLLGIHTEETRIERETCTPMFITALFTIASTWKQPRCPSADEWIRKLWYIYSMEY